MLFSKLRLWIENVQYKCTIELTFANRLEKGNESENMMYLYSWCEAMDGKVHANSMTLPSAEMCHHLEVEVLWKNN